ncbi:hypothetical protein KY290_035205 [Solanum tuberosum]|uniref:DUF4283 domain-containing protein n=1 Tax=Solanum tuberosum TaxID=4113 RepID=A0ABQ7U5E6_SOLTU|nr:hypothetical protein KY290_035205 [Solanum tuberosum]
MEGTLANDRFKPPDPSTVMHKPIISSSLQESSSESTYSFSQVTEARNSGESSQNRHQNRSTAEEIHADSAIGSGNIGREGHNIAASSTFHGGIAGAGDYAGIPSKNFKKFQYVEEIRGLSQTQTQHREGKQLVQDLGQSSTPHMDEQFIKKQEMRMINNKLGFLKNRGKILRLILTLELINRRSDRPPVNPPNLPKTDPLSAPAPYTVVQTYADRLRYNPAKCDVPIILTAPEITTKQGLHVVLYVKEEVLRDLAAAWKFTLIGKFSYTMPKLELIRKNFILQTQLSGGVKIAHFNSRHVYIDLDNKLDYNMVWTKQRMCIAGHVMRIQVWTPNFKPAEETPIVPIWISLPELPWHFYNKEFESSHSLAVLDNYKGTKGDSRPHTGATNQKGQHEYNMKIANVGKDTTKQLQVDIISKQVTKINKGNEVYTGKAGTSIDSMLPSPNPIDNVGNIIAEVAVGGLDGREQETHTELQEGVTPDDYGALNSEDDLDPDNQSLEESDEDAKDTMKHTGQVVGSSFQDKCTDVQRITEQQDNTHIDLVRSQLQMDHAVTNPNGKIWVFWSNEVTGHILEKHAQHITITFKHTDISEKFMMSFIYAKCKDYVRRSLWDRLIFYANMDLRWCTIGDFNVITSIEEKLGGIPYNMNKSFDFIGMIQACGLTYLGYTGLPFTWCNQRDAEARVWKWLEVIPQTTIENLSSISSDHSPLLLGVTGNPMWKLHQKLKRVTDTLSNWSKHEYGDIFRKVKEFEETIRNFEAELMTNNNAAVRQNLLQLNATYIKYLKMEESVLKQKTQLQWFKDDDANTKFFHALMRGRRRRLFLHKVCTANEVWIQGEEHIDQAACEYYQQMFTGPTDRIDEIILQFIPTAVTLEHNEMLQAMHNIEELRQVVFSMNQNSVAGPDGIGAYKIH